MCTGLVQVAVRGAGRVAVDKCALVLRTAVAGGVVVRVRRTTDDGAVVFARWRAAVSMSTSRSDCITRSRCAWSKSSTFCSLASAASARTVSACASSQSAAPLAQQARPRKWQNSCKTCTDLQKGFTNQASNLSTFDDSSIYIQLIYLHSTHHTSGEPPV